MPEGLVMINNKFLLYLLCGVMFSPALALGECKPTQDCRALGYKEAPCPEQGVKCPFGETWYCPLRCKDGQVWKDGKCTDVLGSCSGAAKNCKIGQILNSDASCSDNKVSGKTPIGVVVYISGGSDKCGYAMTASPIATSIQWSTEYVNTGAFQSSNWQNAIKDFDVSGNMTKIIQAANGNSSKYPAAYAALNYAPSAAPTSKGKWALPTAGILSSLYTNLNAINNTISKLGGTQLTNDNEHIWSSSESNTHYAWVFWAGYGAIHGGVDYYYKTSYRVVRPVLAF